MTLAWQSTYFADKLEDLPEFPDHKVVFVSRNVDGYDVSSVQWKAKHQGHAVGQILFMNEPKLTPRMKRNLKALVAAHIKELTQ